MFQKFREYFTFTKNEQKVFFFLALIFLTGASIKVVKAYTTDDAKSQFDYSASDKKFAEYSENLTTEIDSSATQKEEPKKEKKSKSSKGKKSKITEGTININTASKEELTKLPGVGEGMAEKIILYRDEHGGFKKKEELRKVKGIGAKKYEKLEQFIEVQ